MKNQIEIDRLLNSVGTHTFIDYFFEFKNLDKKSLKILFETNKENWKENSFKQKANNGKRIFKEKRELEALQHILEAKNLKNIPDGIVIKQKAKIYYNSLK